MNKVKPPNLNHHELEKKILHECEVVQLADQMRCELCNLTWDVNDSDPPKCQGWKINEHIIENKYCDYVEQNNCASFKFELRRSDPDQMTMLGNGYHFFIEFKRKGEQPGTLQIIRHQELRELGYAVYCTSSLKDAIKIFDSEKYKMEKVPKKVP